MKLKRFAYVLFFSMLATAPFITNEANAAGTLTGQVGVQVVIKDGCSVGNNNSSGSVNQWGSLNFGTYADLANIIDGRVIGSDGNSSVTVTCTKGLSPTLSLDGGLYPKGTLREMSSGNAFIPYRLYSDPSYKDEIALNGKVSLVADGNSHDVPIYGRILPSDQSTKAPPAGTYNDTVTATLAW